MAWPKISELVELATPTPQPFSFVIRVQNRFLVGTDCLLSSNLPIHGGNSWTPETTLIVVPGPLLIASTLLIPRRAFIQYTSSQHLQIQTSTRRRTSNDIANGNILMQQHSTRQQSIIPRRYIPANYRHSTTIYSLGVRAL